MSGSLGGSGSLTADPSGRGNEHGKGDGSDADSDGGGKGAQVTGDSPPDAGTDRHVRAPDGGTVVDSPAGEKSSLAQELEEKAAADLPPGKHFSAADFRYDKSGLPRYPNSVEAVSSSLSYPRNAGPNTYSSGCAIATSDSFDEVLAWYRQHLPGGWHDQTSGDFACLAQQLSPERLQQMLGFKSSTSPQVGGAAPAPKGPTISISVFSPPAGTPGRLGVMIAQQESKAVIVMLKTTIP